LKFFLHLLSVFDFVVGGAKSLQSERAANYILVPFASELWDACESDSVAATRMLRQYGGAAAVLQQ
jgi:hypothetical protein